MKRTVLLLGVVGILLFSPSVLLSQQDEVDRIDLKQSKKLTVFEGPLLPDGRIDFIAALNEHTSKGVTHENNAFRAMFLLMPVDEEQEIDPDQPSVMTVMSNKLEITQEERDRTAPLVGWFDYALANGLTYEEINDVESSVSELNFTHPKIERFKQWLISQEPGFKQLVTAINRPKYWRPETEAVERPGSGQFSVGFPGKQYRLAGMLGYRARYALSQGDRQVFIESLASIYRLSDQVAQGPFLIDRLVANATEVSALDLLHQALRDQKLDGDNLAAIQRMLENRMPRPPMTEIMAIGEHVFAVSYFIAYATGKDSIGRMYNGIFMDPVDSSALDDAIQKIGVDLDVGLRLIAVMGKLDAAAWKSKTLKDYARLDEVRKNLWKPRWDLIKEKHIEEDEDGKRRIKVPRASRNPGALAELIIDLPYVLIGDTFDFMGHGIYTFDARRQVSEAALALERYRLANGQYPDRLEDLLPKYRHELPIDPMDGKPLRYRREADGSAVIYSIYKNMKDDGGTTDPGDSVAVAEGDYAWRLELPKE